MAFVVVDVIDGSSFCLLKTLLFVMIRASFGNFRCILMTHYRIFAEIKKKLFEKKRLREEAAKRLER